MYMYTYVSKYNTLCSNEEARVVDICGGGFSYAGLCWSFTCVSWRHRVLCPALHPCVSTLWTSTPVCMSEKSECSQVITVLINQKKITVECSEWIHLSLELSQKLEEQAKGEACVWLVSWSPNLEMCCLMFFCQPSTVWHMVTMKTVVAAVCIQCLPCARNSAQPNSSQP